MSKFAFALVLKVEEFEAETLDEAEEKLNDFIDQIAEVEETELIWPETDWIAYQDGVMVRDFYQPLP
jgi:hypothetical protein